MNVQRVSTGGAWEKKVGYCRALRTGNFVFVSGAAPVKDGQVVAPQLQLALLQNWLEAFFFRRVRVHLP
jgi:enamine deaminase RidA (YjgF/YER057c/UK114 family)